MDSLPAGRPEGAGGAEEEACAEGGRGVVCLGLKGWGTRCRGGRNSAMARLSLEPSQLAKAGCDGLRWRRSFQEGFLGTDWRRQFPLRFLGAVWLIFLFLRQFCGLFWEIGVAEQEFDLKFLLRLPMSLRDMGKWRCAGERCESSWDEFEPFACNPG